MKYSYPEYQKTWQVAHQAEIKAYKRAYYLAHMDNLQIAHPTCNRRKSNKVIVKENV